MHFLRWLSFLFVNRKFVRKNIEVSLILSIILFESGNHFFLPSIRTSPCKYPTYFLEQSTILVRLYGRLVRWTCLFLPLSLFQSFFFHPLPPKFNLRLSFLIRFSFHSATFSTIYYSHRSGCLLRFNFLIKLSKENG